MYLNPLFPAIVEDHITAGLGLDFNEASSLNAALSFALENDALAGSGVTSEHSQLSWQLMYTYRY
jgi:long-chain fatty acid transport protein